MSHYLPIAHPFLTSLFVSLTALPAFSAAPVDTTESVGKPTLLRAQPSTVTLADMRDHQQLIVTGQYADGSVRDLTGLCRWTSADPTVATIDATGFLTPHKGGKTSIIAQVGGVNVGVPVTVREFSKAEPISFRHEVIAALNVGGCNQGACHGSPSGKGGFRLSLRGFDPDADYLQLTRDIFGRRTDSQQPDASLILRKSLGRMPHEGGQRFLPGSVPERILHAWLAGGSPLDPSTQPGLQGIEILPGSRVLTTPAAHRQQLAVLARFTDGSVRDVTRLTVFSSSDTFVADVTGTGLVAFQQVGEVAILCRYLQELKTVYLTYLEPRSGFAWTNPPRNNYVDTFVFTKLKLLNILPSHLCADHEFIRRAYLDVCGILPTPRDVKYFLADTAVDKRTQLIDALLDRPEYADLWTLKWSDVLRSTRKAIRVKGTQVFQHWLHDHIAGNTGFDKVVYELLTASGSTFANPPANYYRIAREPQSLVETTAQVFLGLRLQCAKCHNHPFERWTQDDYYSLAAFFARVKQQAAGPNEAGAEIIGYNPSGTVMQPTTNRVMTPKFLGGAVASLPQGVDRRRVLADWLVDSSNPFFAKSVVNRIWYHLCGKGIVDPVDDFRDSNPPTNTELLDALAKDFVDHHFDMKHIIRTIMNSRTYQLSVRENAFNKDDAKYFSHAVTKSLSAEQLLDALCTAVGVPERFDGFPPGTRAVQLPDGESNHPFLKRFGQPARELACECERESDSSLARVLESFNGMTVIEKLRKDSNRIGQLLARKKSDREILEELYLATLSRMPTPADSRFCLEHVARAGDKGANKRKAWEDIHWALLNTKEFLFRH